MSIRRRIASEISSLTPEAQKAAAAFILRKRQQRAGTMRASKAASKSDHHRGILESGEYAAT